MDERGLFGGWIEASRGGISSRWSLALDKFRGDMESKSLAFLGIFPDRGVFGRWEPLTGCRQPHLHFHQRRSFVDLGWNRRDHRNLGRRSGFSRWKYVDRAGRYAALCGHNADFDKLGRLMADQELSE